MQRDSFPVLSFPSIAGYQSGAPGELRILIATEEIIGPVRNGGIASTYYHLARGLAAEGHAVTVIYLKGREVENETPEHWIEHYSAFGIDFVPLPDLGEPLAGASVAWQRRWLAFYRWLEANDRFDVVHTSEWRGGAHYCLQAKRLGLAFADTLFIVKTSSPYIWNRHYQMQPIDNVDLLVASFAEQKCVEWADMVIGGSAHLLSFMDHVGYRLPEGRTYVQPNIVDFSRIEVEDKRPARVPGETVHTRELVFFGRLEPRKGLDLFVLALDALVSRGTEIERVTFLGKEGEPIAAHGGARPLDFIRGHAERWPFPVDIVTDLNQPEALALMCSRDMIAVMPSRIENSTMAVYETLVHRIPFIASAVGGTPELIDPASHGVSLVPPDTGALAERLAEALEGGQPLARPAFDGDENLSQWYGFHHYLAERGVVALMPPRSSTTVDETVAWISYCRTAEELGRTALLCREYPDISEFRLYAPFALSEPDRAEFGDLRDSRITITEMIGASAGACFNHARAETGAAVLVFDATGSAAPAAELAPALRTALAARRDDLVTAAFHFDVDGRGTPDTLFAPLGGDPASQALTGAAYGLDLIAGRKSTFEALGPFEDYHVTRGTTHEMIARAVCSGRELFVIPHPLLTSPLDHGAIAGEDGQAGYLSRMPMLEASALPVRKLLLHQPDAARRTGNRGRIILGQAHRDEGETAWLTNIDKVGRPAGELPNRHHILLGFDKQAARLDFAALHDGELIILANGAEIRRDLAFGKRGAFTRAHVDLLPLLEGSDRLRLRIELTRTGRTRFASILAQRIEPDIYFLSARSPIFWDEDFDEVLALLGGERAVPPLPPLRRMPDGLPSLVHRVRTRLRGDRR